MKNLQNELEESQNILEESQNILEQLKDMNKTLEKDILLTKIASAFWFFVACLMIIKAIGII